jgi:hypothetical protein
MNIQTTLKMLSALALIFIFFTSSAEAHQPHECPPGDPESPALPGHLSQDELMAGRYRFDEIIATGQEIFEAVFNRCDGQGRPATTGGGEKRQPDEPFFIRTSGPDSSACAGCHNQPGIGGGGDFVANVFVLAQTLDPVTDSVSPEFSNERNTLGMFGAGPIEMLGREMSADLQAIRRAALSKSIDEGKAITVALISKGIEFGTITVNPDGFVDSSAVEGVDPDLIIKPFHQSGVVRSIREFTVNGMNHHHGMQAEERFDLNPQKGMDFDEDGIAYELSVGDITAISLFQAALGTPGQVLPSKPAERGEIERGEDLFSQVGCSSCHVPVMTLESRFFSEPNPGNPTGTFNDSTQSITFDMTRDGMKPRLERTQDGGAIVRAYTDLKRHNLCDPPDHPDPIRFFCNEQHPQGRPDQRKQPGIEFFITRKLWDVGSSAPYGHRGDLTTLTEAILYHGGEARDSRDNFASLPTDDQKAIVEFLKTLQVLPEGTPLVISHDPVKSQTVTLESGWPMLVLGLVSLALSIFQGNKRHRKVSTTGEIRLGGEGS